MKGHLAEPMLKPSVTSLFNPRNDVKAIRTIKQASRVNLDFDSPRLK